MHFQNDDRYSEIDITKCTLNQRNVELDDGTVWEGKKRHIIDEQFIPYT